MLKSFADAIGETAEHWPARHETLQQRLDVQPSPYPTHRPYIDVVPIILERVRVSADGARARELSKSHGVRHGLSVIARYYCHAFESAVHNNIPLWQAADQLRSIQPDDNPMHHLARFPNAIVIPYEDMIGTAKDAFCRFDARYDMNYSWHEGIYTPTQHIQLSLQAELNYRRQAQAEGHAPENERDGRPMKLDGRCPAEKSKQLERISQSVLDICLRDELLAQRTYALGITNCRPNG